MRRRVTAIATGELATEHGGRTVRVAYCGGDADIETLLRIKARRLREEGYEILWTSQCDGTDERPASGWIAYTETTDRGDRPRWQTERPEPTPRPN